jgi:hypothetical protein
MRLLVYCIFSYLHLNPTAMKKLFYLLLALTLLSCKPKSNEPIKTEAERRSEYLQKALESDSYKNEYMNIQRVKDGLDSVKKGSLDPKVVIFEYNNSIATPTSQVTTISQVEKEMKKDTAYLKAVQLKVAADLASSDSINMNSKTKH